MEKEQTARKMGEKSMYNLQNFATYIFLLKKYSYFLQRISDRKVNERIQPRTSQGFIYSSSSYTQIVEGKKTVWKVKGQSI